MQHEMMVATMTEDPCISCGVAGPDMKVVASVVVSGLKMEFHLPGPYRNGPWVKTLSVPFGHQLNIYEVNALLQFYCISIEDFVKMMNEVYAELGLREEAVTTPRLFTRNSDSSSPPPS